MASNGLWNSVAPLKQQVQALGKVLGCSTTYYFNEFPCLVAYLKKKSRKGAKNAKTLGQKKEEEKGE